MSGEIHASFIPKREVRSKKTRGSSGSSNVFLLIGVIIFLSSLLASGGAFLWDRQLDASNQRALSELQENQDNYGIATIQTFIDVHNRIEAGNQLIANHINVAGIFDILEADTLSEIHLDEFDFSTEGDSIVVSATGYAPPYSYNHVALQSDKYGANNVIKELLLSNVNQSQEGSTTFDLNFKIDRDVLIINE